MNFTDREIFLMRLEPKWQFRRGLLLCSAKILKGDNIGDAWQKILADLSRRKSNPDDVIHRLADNWKKRSTSPKAFIQFILENFEKDTAEGPARHRLQDLSEGHPSAAIITETQRAEIYRQAYHALQPSPL